MAQQLGLDKGSYDSILKQMSDAPDPEVFRSQFSQLAEQKQLLGTPVEIDKRGYHVPSGEQEDYYRSWTKQLIGQLTTPQEFGGQGYSLPQARMVAIASGRKKWPQVDPSAFAKYASPQSGIFPKSSTVDVDAGGPLPEQEVGAMKAAKLKPERIAEILTFKTFGEVNEKAAKYKETAGNAANAADFARFVVEDRIAKNMSGVKQAQSQVKEAENAVNTLRAQKKVADAAGEDTAEVETQLASAELQLAQMKAAVSKIPDAAAVEQEAYKWFSDFSETIAVASATNNLY